MSTTSDTGFRTAIMGYHRSDVDTYVSRLKSEQESQEERLKGWEERIGEQKEEIRKLNETLEEERREKTELEEKQSALQKELEALQEKLREEEEKNEVLRNEYEDYRSRIEAEGVDPKIIQDAILNAQRMSDIVIVEAQQKAMDIREKARKEKRQSEEESRQLMEEARTEAERVTEEAERKCVNLQKEYDRILLDVTGFKAELMKMYRKHMELLAALPQKDIIEIEKVDV